MEADIQATSDLPSALERAFSAQRGLSTAGRRVQARQLELLNDEAWRATKVLKRRSPAVPSSGSTSVFTKSTKSVFF